MKQNGNGALGLSALGLEKGIDTPGKLGFFAPNHALTEKEQQIQAQWREQVLVMDGTNAKAVMAMNFIAGFHKHGVVTFDESAEFITKVQEEAVGKNHQAYTDEFCVREIQALGRHMLGITEVGATIIAAEVQHSLYPQVEPKGFFRRLFG